MQATLTVWAPDSAPDDMPIYENSPAGVGEVLVSGTYNGLLTIDLDGVSGGPFEITTVVRIGWDNGPTVELEQDSHV